VEFDRATGLHSLPARLGPKRALALARLFHGLMVVFLLLTGWAAHLGGWYFAGVALTAALIAVEHIIIRPDDLRKLNVAFFNVNIAVSAGLLLFTALDLFL
jgi:4-hydroxybenzoate polyprenyltransferase